MTEKSSEEQSEVGEAAQHSSGLQFIRRLLAHCFIEVDSHIIPRRSSMDEWIAAQQKAPVTITLVP